MDRSIPVQCNATIEVACRAEHVHVGLPIVVLIRLVYIGLRDEQDSCAQDVPVEPDLVCLIEGLLT